jgi:hypothetical protein
VFSLSDWCLEKVKKYTYWDLNSSIAEWVQSFDIIRPVA